LSCAGEFALADWFSTRFFNPKKLNRIKQDLSQLYSRENAVLREARDQAQNEKENLELANQR